jgi:hypothetical protein
LCQVELFEIVYSFGLKAHVKRVPPSFSSMKAFWSGPLMT